jgi:hypothetical protein
VVAAKTPPGELDLALSQVHEAVLLADLVGRAVPDRGKGVDLPNIRSPRALSRTSRTAWLAIPRF